MGRAGERRRGNSIAIFISQKGSEDAGAGLCSEGHSKSPRGISPCATVPGALTGAGASSGWVVAEGHGQALLAQPLGPPKPAPGLFLMENK